MGQNHTIRKNLVKHLLNEPQINEPIAYHRIKFFPRRNLDPNPDLGNFHCERSEAILACSMRLPRTFQVLAKTGWEKGFIL